VGRGHFRYFDYSIINQYQVKSTVMDIRTITRSCFSPLVLIGAFFIALLLFSATFLFLSWSRPGPIPDPPGTAVMRIIAAPTETPVPATPTSDIFPTQAQVESRITVGGMVKVVGTGGDGLRLRYSPGLDNQVRLLAAEGENFQIADGPQQVDNYTWWYLENPLDRTRRGWAVADFLEAALNP
jgi:hypothetical protein